MPSRPLRVPPFWSFFLLAVILRWGSFFLSVIDHDESTYIVIADELLRGKVYLRDVIDTKPIGIFWVYALLNTVTGGSIPLLRLATTAVIALGAWGLYWANLRATGQRTAGYVAGALYVLMNSLFARYGMAPNTEHYFNTLTIWAVALSVAAPRKRWGWAGLLLGLAFIIKPFAAAEAGAVGLYLVWHYRRDVPRMLGRGLQLVVTWALPLAAVVGYYWWLELLPALWFYSVAVSAAYPIELPWYLRLKYMGEYLLRYSPFILVALAGTRVRGTSGQREWLYYLALQALFVATVILLIGKRFEHYQIQLHPVVALAVGTLVGRAWPRLVLRRGWLPVAVLIGAFTIGTVHAVYYARKQDIAAALTSYFTDRLGPGQQVLGQHHQIVYHLLDRSPPLPYVHTSIIFDEHLRSALGVDVEALVQRLITNPRLEYFYTVPPGKELQDDPLTERLLPYFEEVDRLSSGTVIYRRITPSPVSSTGDRSVKRDR